jgi:hypothetical protein|tara:strand:- start:1113 stop:1289 length:177 start_codon:yes stop_codon:yes gene_type:complete
VEEAVAVLQRTHPHETPVYDVSRLIDLQPVREHLSLLRRVESGVVAMVVGEKVCCGVG